MMKFDIAEYFTSWIGDTLAQGLNNLTRRSFQRLQYDFQRKQRYLTEIITEEWLVTLGPLEVTWHGEKIRALERQVCQLEQRLQYLETK